jgi:carbamoyltransferase
MNVLAISGWDCNAAAALAVDGCVLAAASEESFARLPGIGYRATGGFPSAAAAACLERSGLAERDISVLAVVGRDGNGAARASQAFERALRRRPPVAALVNASVARVAPVDAHLAQLLAVSDAEQSLLIIAEPAIANSSAAYLLRDGRAIKLHAIVGFERLARAARRIACTLGCAIHGAFEALEETGRGGDLDFAEPMEQAMGWGLQCVLSVDEEAIGQIVRRASGCEHDLGNVASPNIDLQRRRRALAESFFQRVSQLLVELGQRLCLEHRVTRVGLGGSLFSIPRLNSNLRPALGTDIDLSPVPEGVGLALGAALAAWPPVDRKPLVELTLGPAFSESQIKGALENCRLDYVYEPDWQRLLARTSSLLAGGKTIAWFQGPADFGPRSLAGRSILCDPSHRWARENIQTYLRLQTTESPLPVTMSQSAADECLKPPNSSRFMLFRAQVKQAFHDRLIAALDGDSVTVHTFAPERGPLCDLVALHRDRTGVPGEPMACTPRDAVRTTYSAAIDALIIGRFLVMKDHWLLRSYAVH